MFDFGGSVPTYGPHDGPNLPGRELDIWVVVVGAFLIAVFLVLSATIVVFASGDGLPLCGGG